MIPVRPVQIDHVVLIAGDMDPAVTFYPEVLGHGD
jgi:catechol 2,3-dioxygenase-like lactoylglutathione lyase family enzyme